MMIALLQCILLTSLVVSIIIMGVYIYRIAKKKIQLLSNIREIERNILEDIKEEEIKRRLNNPPPYAFRFGYYPVWPRR